MKFFFNWFHCYLLCKSSICGILYVFLATTKKLNWKQQCTPQNKKKVLTKFLSKSFNLIYIILGHCVLWLQITWPVYEKVHILFLHVSILYLRFLKHKNVIPMSLKKWLKKKIVRYIKTIRLGCAFKKIRFLRTNKVLFYETSSTLMYNRSFHVDFDTPELKIGFR